MIYRRSNDGLKCNKEVLIIFVGDDMRKIIQVQHDKTAWHIFNEIRKKFLLCFFITGVKLLQKNIYWTKLELEMQ